jgi:hypothetical protein
MSAELAAKLLTLLTLAEVWLKMRAHDDLALAHFNMREILNCFPDAPPDLLSLVKIAEIWRQKKNAAEVAGCHAEMRALLEGVAA